MAEELAGGISKPVMVHVDGPADVRRARETALALARELGFAGGPCEEIALAVTELGTNLLRHASRGTITVTPAETGGSRGIRIDSADSGPGIRDIERAITDGYSTAGGLGLGLGTVNRLMDELDIHPGERGGLHVTCQRWTRPASLPGLERRLLFGIATRPRRHGEENGDAFLIKQWEDNALVGVIDGLGHGQFAHRASQTARQYLETHFDQPLANLFRGTGRACRATRGVVMALARFDFARRIMAVANIGNIEVRVLTGGNSTCPILRRGIVGMNAPSAVVSEFPWASGSVLIMHSDGLSSHWRWDQFEPIAKEDHTKAAQRMLHLLAKPEDDATVLLVGNAS